MITKVRLRENYRKNLKDSLSATEKRPKGQVHIYELTPDGKKKLLEKQNLVVYQGRQWLMQRATNQLLPGQPASTTNSFISWLGLGTGGTASNLMVPIAPKLTDTNLLTPAIINNKPGTDCINGGLYHPFDSISYLEDAANGNQELIASFLTTIGVDDANGPNGGTTQSDFYDLSEAGLYVSDSINQADFEGPSAADHLASIKLFARVTFSTIRKFPERVIIFNWYVYF